MARPRIKLPFVLVAGPGLTATLPCARVGRASDGMGPEEMRRGLPCHTLVEASAWLALRCGA
eukprot:9476470-Pyramimonas_sp.AAC.1